MSLNPLSIDQVKPRPWGFSLVEILVVVAIVSVLVSLLLPSLSQARHQARKILCGNNQKQLVLGTLSYAIDHKDKVPYGGFERTPPDVPYGRYCFDTQTRKRLFEDYGLSVTKVWWCPSGVWRANPVMPESYFDRRWFTDPSYGPAWTGNPRSQTGYGYYLGPRRFLGDPLYKLEQVNRISESKSPSERTAWSDPLMEPGRAIGAITGWTMPVNTHDTQGNCIPTGAYSAMLDGHVEWRTYVWNVTTVEWRVQYFIFR
jgi:prepilin-type N-terminal cleavage/methylation domain-containing protein